MKQCRSRLFLLTVVACLTACATAKTPEEKSPPGVTGIPPPALVRQPEGTPLPPRDPRIAERWPPEIKKLVDNMLTLFPSSADDRPPTVKEVERKMEITLTEVEREPGDSAVLLRRFEISGTPYISPELRRYGVADHYFVFRGRPPARPHRQSLQLLISPKQTGFCLNPYELAVYTGSSFVNGETSTHARTHEWPPAYVWGMFAWSKSGKYVGQGFSIGVGENLDPNTQEPKDSGCVTSIAVSGKFHHEKE